MNEIIAYWQDMGVGGFRCDMAHMVPLPFWRWIIAHARLRDRDVFFIAEGYNDHLKLQAGSIHEGLLSAGFNGVYDGAAYEALRNIYEGSAWANDLDRLHREETPLFCGGVRYIENHDEPRIASPLYWGGVGSRVIQAAMVAQYGTGRGPVLLYNGQEFGECAAGPSGYGGDNGRTSIFDYTTLPALQHWSNGGTYDGALLSEAERELHAFTLRMVALLQHPALSKGGFYGLNWANLENESFGRRDGDSVSGHTLYAFLRHHRKSKSTLLLVCNLSATDYVSTHIHIPENAMRWAAKKPGMYSFIPLLNTAAPINNIDSETLESTGFPVSLLPGTAEIFEWC